MDRRSTSPDGSPLRRGRTELLGGVAALLLALLLGHLDHALSLELVLALARALSLLPHPLALALVAAHALDLGRVAGRGNERHRRREHPGHGRCNQCTLHSHAVLLV